MNRSILFIICCVIEVCSFGQSYEQVNDTLALKLHSDFVSRSLDAVKMQQLDSAFLYRDGARYIIKESIGKKNQYYIEDLFFLSSMCENYYCDYPKALAYDEEALSTLNSIDSGGNDTKLYFLARIASEKSLLNEYSASIDYAERAYYMAKELHPNDENIYKYIALLIEVCLDGNSVEKAKKYSSIYSEYAKGLLKHNTIEYARFANIMSQVYSYSQKYNNAIEYGEKAIATIDSIVGTDNATYVKYAYHLAHVYFENLDYKKALLLSNRILDISQKIPTTYDSFLRLLSRNAIYLCYNGKIDDAISKGEQAMKLAKQIYGTQSFTYAIYQGYLANIYYHNNDIINAIRLATDSVNIMSNCKEKDIETYIAHIENLAGYYTSIGDYDFSLKLYSEAANLSEVEFDKTSIKYAGKLFNLAQCYYGIGYYDKALECGTKALKLYEELAPKSDEFIEALSSQSVWLSINNMRDEAIKTSIKAYELALQSSTNKELLEHNSLCSMAKCYYDASDHENAIKYFTLAKSLSLNSRYKSVYWAVDQLLSESYFHQNNTNKGTECLASYISGKVNEVLNMFLALTKTERDKIWYNGSFFLTTRIHQRAYDCMTEELIKLGYNSILFTKGFLLNTDIAIQNIIDEDPHAKEIQNKIKFISKQNNLLDNQSKYSVLTDSVYHYEVELAKICNKKTGALDNLRQINWESVRSNLTSSDIAIEFVSFPADGDSTIYCSYVLRKDFDSPKLVVNCIIPNNRKLNSIYAYTEPEISMFIWQPLEEYLKDIKNIYFSPAGELYNIAIESLQDWNNSGILLSERWNFYRLSSTRELCLPQSAQSLERSAVYGGLKYDADSETLVNNSLKYPKRGSTIFSYSNGVSKLRSTLEDLPGTKIEAINIDKKLKSAKILDSLYTDTIGTEASFKALSGKGINLMHIATHGFYWTESEAQQMTNVSSFTFFNNNDIGYTEDRSLTRSGLFFAGACNTLNGLTLPENVDNGILTAQEITQLDFSNLDLVVLSACQTGLGEITGDGVYGLQRGFKKAGAKSILMSLWTVDDDATQLLMTKFYSCLISGESKRQALLDAQNYVRNYEVEKTIKLNTNLTMSQKRRLKNKGQDIRIKTEKRIVKPYADPKFWAAFILLDAIE